MGARTDVLAAVDELTALDLPFGADRVRILLLGLLVGWIVGHILSILLPFPHRATARAAVAALHDIDRKRDDSKGWDYARPSLVAGPWLLKYHHCQPRFIRYPDFDRVPWVNDAIDELWPVVRDFARDFVHQKVKPLVDKYLSAVPGVECQLQVDVGDRPPRLGGLKVYRQDATAGASASLEAHFMWGSNMSVTVGLKLGGGKWFLTVPLVQFSDLLVNATARITAAPFVPQLPVAAAIRVSLVEPPNVDFDLRLFAPYNLKSVPILGDAMDLVIRFFLMKYVGFPNSIPIVLDPAELAEPEGLVTIKNLRVRGLRSLPMAGIIALDIPDPFVRVSCLPGRHRRTRTINKHFSAHFPEECTLLVKSRERDILRLNLHDDKLFGEGPELCAAEVELRDGSEAMKAISEGRPYTVTAVQEPPKALLHLPTCGGGRTPGYLEADIEFKPLNQPPMEKRIEWGRTFSTQPVRHYGVLIVTVHRCMDLGDDGMSPYVRVRILDREGHTKFKERTNLDPNTADPTFETSFEFAGVTAADKLVFDVRNSGYGAFGLGYLIRKAMLKATSKNLGTLTVPVADVVGPGRLGGKHFLKQSEVGQCPQIVFSLQWITIWPSSPLTPETPESVEREGTSASAP